MANGKFNGPFRQSLLKLYSMCPRKFKLLEVDGIEVEVEKSDALLKGTYVHEVINDFHKKRKVNLRNYNIPEEIRDEVAELVDVYIQHNSDLDVVHSEIEFGFKLCRYEIQGTVDLIYRDKNSQTVLRDVKTDQAEPTPEYLSRDLQFSIYYLGALKGLGIQVDRLEWFHVRNLIPYKRKTVKNGVEFQPGDIRGNPSIPVSRKVEDIPNIKQEIKYFIQAITHGVLPMRPLKIGRFCPCDGCEVGEYCKPMGEIVKQRTEFNDLPGFANYF